MILENGLNPEHYEKETEMSAGETEPEMDTSDWAVPPETEKMLRGRIAVLEDCLLNVIGGQQDPNIKAEDLPSLVFADSINTDGHIADLEAALKKADELARFVHDNPPTTPTGNFGYPVVDPRYQALVDHYQTQRAKVKK